MTKKQEELLRYIADGPCGIRFDVAMCKAQPYYGLSMSGLLTDGLIDVFDKKTIKERYRITKAGKRLLEALDSGN
jgi:hypothetical protein